MSIRKKQILILFIVSILGAAGGIVHGVFFDLDWSQIGRLSFFGVIFTTFIVFPAILLFEYIFDLNNKQEIRQLKQRIEQLEIQSNIRQTKDRGQQTKE